MQMYCRQGAMQMPYMAIARQSPRATLALVAAAAATAVAGEAVAAALVRVLHLAVAWHLLLRAVPLAPARRASARDARRAIWATRWYVWTR